MSPIAMAILPPPPDLATDMRPWRDRELFWIIKNGIKYTGMPGWSAQERDDEVGPARVRAAVAGLLVGAADVPEPEPAGLVRAPERLADQLLPAVRRLVRVHAVGERAAGRPAQQPVAEQPGVVARAARADGGRRCWNVRSAHVFVGVRLNARIAMIVAGNRQLPATRTPIL